MISIVSVSIKCRLNDTHPYPKIYRKIHRGGAPPGTLAEGPQNTKHAPENRAALQAVSTSSGLEEGGASYDQQARENMQGVRVDHIAVSQTADTMQKVFMDLDEKRKEGKEHYTFSR